MAPRILQGEGPRALGERPAGVLLLKELAMDFEVGPGDTLPITIYPDDFEKSTNLKLHVLGVYGSFPPTSPPPDQPAELVMSTAAIPRRCPRPRLLPCPCRPRPVRQRGGRRTRQNAWTIDSA